MSLIAAGFTRVCTHFFVMQVQFSMTHYFISALEPGNSFELI